MDQELKAYLDEKFERIDDRFERIDERFERIDGRFERMDERFERIDERFERMDERFEKVETAIRHTQVSVEGVRSDLRLVAEGVMGVSERLESFQAETARNFEQVKASIAPAYRDLDNRVKVLESRAERQTMDVIEAIRQKFGTPQ